MPTEYTEKHGKRAKIKGKKSKGEFMPAAQDQGQKQGQKAKNKGNGESEFMPAAQGQKQGQRRTSKAKKS
ncbi:MAG: hypothetical protein R6U68_17300 [Desulfobacteraceae bacterium]